MQNSTLSSVTANLGINYGPHPRQVVLWEAAAEQHARYRPLPQKSPISRTSQVDF